MSTFSKKSLYHSDLAGHTANGPQPIVLLGAPQASKYQGKPPYVRISFPGDPGEYNLSIEHAGIQTTLAAQPLNVPLMVQAMGRGDAAVVQVHGAANGAAAPQQYAPPAQTQQAAQAYQPPQHAPAYVAPAQKPPMTHLYAQCMSAAHSVVTGFLEHSGDAFLGLSPEARLAVTKDIATHFSIELCRNPDQLLRGGQQPAQAPLQAPQPVPAAAPPAAPAPQPVAAGGGPFGDDPDSSLPF
jgi:hypothetical protein